MKIFPHELVGIFGRLFWGIMLLSFRYIGDTLGYDRSRHVSEVINDLRVSHPGVGVHPVPGPPGDDLLGRR